LAFNYKDYVAIRTNDPEFRERMEAIMEQISQMPEVQEMLVHAHELSKLRPAAQTTENQHRQAEAKGEDQDKLVISDILPPSRSLDMGSITRYSPALHYISIDIANELQGKDYIVSYAPNGNKGDYKNDVTYPWSLQRTVVHEIFHAADPNVGMPEAILAIGKSNLSAILPNKAFDDVAFPQIFLLKPEMDALRKAWPAMRQKWEDKGTVFDMPLQALLNSADLETFEGHQKSVRKMVKEAQFPSSGSSAAHVAYAKLLAHQFSLLTVQYEKDAIAFTNTIMQKYFDEPARRHHDDTNDSRPFDGSLSSMGADHIHNSITGNKQDLLPTEQTIAALKDCTRCDTTNIPEFGTFTPSPVPQVEPDDLNDPDKFRG
jgi:hypothetical protein